MIVQVIRDEMMNRFEVGDVVVFSLEDDSVYSYEVPKLGTLGVIEIQTHSFGLEKMLGVQIPMSVIQWEDGQKSSVFSHDITKVDLSGDEKIAVVTKLKSLTPYTGENYN